MIGKAAWKYIKFATGPIGASMMVNATGYLLATPLPVQRDLLAIFYRDNPNHMISIRQQDVITDWYALRTFASTTFRMFSPT